MCKFKNPSDDEELQFYDVVDKCHMVYDIASKKEAFFRDVLIRYIVYFNAQYTKDETSMFKNELKQYVDATGADKKHLSELNDRQSFNQAYLRLYSKWYFPGQDKPKLQNDKLKKEQAELTKKQAELTKKRAEFNIKEFKKKQTELYAKQDELYIKQAELNIKQDEFNIQNDLLTKEYTPPDGDDDIFIHVRTFLWILDHWKRKTVNELLYIDLAMLKLCCKIESRIVQIEKKGKNKDSDQNRHKTVTKKMENERDIVAKIYNEKKTTNPNWQKYLSKKDKAKIIEEDLHDEKIDRSYHSIKKDFVILKKEGRIDI